MRVASFLSAGLARKDSHERRFAFCEALESGLNAFEILECVHAGSASSKFAGCLRPPQEQFANDSDFRPVKIERVLKPMFEFGDAAVACANRAHQRLRFQMIQSSSDFVFFEMQNGIAIRLLVAGVGECIQRERIVFRRGDFFFDERSEYASFGGSESNLHDP